MENDYIQINKNTKYKIFESENKVEKCLILDGHWHENINIIMIENNIKSIGLTHGWYDKNIDFLKSMPFLNRIDISSNDITDLSPLSFCKELEYLGMTCKKAKIIPDFSTFKKLEDIRINWNKNFTSIYKCKNLKTLFLHAYKADDLSAFSEMKSLKYLDFRSRSATSLKGIENFPNIEYFEMYSCPKITTITDITACQKLKKIEFENCKRIEDLEVLFELKNLESLDVNKSGFMKSVKGVSRLKHLKMFCVVDSTIVNGDLHELVESDIENIIFSHKKHYTHKHFHYPEEKIISVIPE